MKEASKTTQTYYDLVREFEGQIVAAAAAKACRTQKDIDAYIDAYVYDGGYGNNTIEYMQIFRDAINTVATTPLSIGVLPVFEITWMLGGITTEGKRIEQAASLLLKRMDGLTDGVMCDNYNTYFNPACSLSKRCLQQWIALARNDQPIKGIRADRYKQLICMLAEATKAHKLPVGIWSTLTGEMFPELVTIIFQECNEPNNKSACIADTGTSDTPIYMPFIACNGPGVMYYIKGIVDSAVAGTRISAIVRSISISIPHVTAAIIVALKNSRVPCIESPVNRIGSVFEEVETQRRKMGG